MIGHETCRHDDTYGALRDCLSDKIRAVGDPSLLARLDQLDTDFAFKRNESLGFSSTDAPCRTATGHPAHAWSFYDISDGPNLCPGLE